MRENSNDYYVGGIQHNGEIKGLAIVGNSHIFVHCRKDSARHEPETSELQICSASYSSHFYFRRCVGVGTAGCSSRRPKHFPRQRDGVWQLQFLGAW